MSRNLVSNTASALLFLTLFSPVHSSTLDTKDDILETSQKLASELITFYKGNETGETPGLLLPLPGSKSVDKDEETFYWYQSGVFMNTYIDYWHLTGDDTYNDLVVQGLIHQSGHSFMPPNQSATLGNDDQSVWGSAALAAAEYGLPDPSNETWVDLAIGVFETQRLRWDAEETSKTCNGGLRWQIFTFNAGYDFKQSKYFNSATRFDTDGMWS